MILVLTGASTAADDPVKSTGFVAELPAPESLVLPIVQEVAADSIVRGTYVYEKEPTLSGAVPARTSAYFGVWHGPGHALYKVLAKAVAPRHFKDSSDVGTVTVRYVVEPINGERTRLRIDAVFVESGRRRADLSDGSVEAAEFKTIQDSVNKAQLVQQQAVDARANREKEELARQVLTHEQNAELGRLISAQKSVSALEQRAEDLRRQTEMRVIQSGGLLLSAPFHSAAVLQKLPGRTELLVVIVTRYWYGVETPAGQHGWVHRNELESLP